MQTMINGHVINYRRETVFTLEASKHKKAFKPVAQSVGDPFRIVQLYKNPPRGFKSRLRINGEIFR